MAHEIESPKDFAYNEAGGKPWHIGQTGCLPFPGGGLATADEARKLVLPWEPVEVSLTTVAGPHGGLIVPDAKAIIRPDTGRYLATVGHKRVTLGNNDVAEIIRNVFGEGPIIETVGALRGGERTFYLVKLAATLEVTPGDNLNRFFLVYNPHDGTGSVRVRIVTVRVVCGNTLAIALGEDTREFSIRHGLNVKLATETAVKLLAAEEANRANLATFLRGARERTLTKDEFKGLLDEVAPIPEPNPKAALKADGTVRDNTGRARNTRDFLSTLFYDTVAPLTREGTTVVHNLDGSDLDGGHTAYRAVNTVTQHSDRTRTVRTGGDRKLQNLFDEGQGAEMVRLAVDYLRPLVGV